MQDGRFAHLSQVTGILLEMIDEVHIADNQLLDALQEKDEKEEELVRLCSEYGKLEIAFHEHREKYSTEKDRLQHEVWSIVQPLKKVNAPRFKEIISGLRKDGSTGSILADVLERALEYVEGR